MTWMPLVLAGAAFADDNGASKLEVQVAARPIALGRYNVSVGAEVGLAQDADPGVLLVIPGRFGLSKDLELFATAEYRTVASTLRFPRLGAVYRIIDKTAELGVTAYTDLAVSGTDGATVLAGFPLRVHATKMVSVDTGLLGRLTVVPATYTGVQVPLGVNLNPTRSLFFTVQGAAKVDVTDLNDAFEIPLTTALGFTIDRGEAPLADIGVRANWSDVQTSDVLDVVAFVHFFAL